MHHSRRAARHSRLLRTNPNRRCCRSAAEKLIYPHVPRPIGFLLSVVYVLATIAEKGAGFRSLADPMIDTTSPHGRLILAVLGALSEFERSMILSRTSEGRTRAMARGVRFGRKPKLSQFQIAEAIARRSAGEALTEIGRTYGVSHSTISRL